MVGKELQADVPGTLKKIRAIGYQHVEYFNLPGLTAPEFRKALDDADLKCHSAHLMLNADDLGPAFAAANALKTRYRCARREHEAHMQSPAAEPAAGTDAAWPEIAPLLDQAMARLNEPDRHAIVLRYFENRSLAEVGRALGTREARRLPVVICKAR